MQAVKGQTIKALSVILCCTTDIFDDSQLVIFHQLWCFELIRVLSLVIY